MDRSEVKELREKLQKFLDKFGMSNNLTIEVGSARFGLSNVTFKVDCREKTNDGDVKYSDNENYYANDYAKSSGVKFEGNILGSRFMIDNVCYVVVRYATRGKYKFHATTSEGSSVKFDNEFLNKGYQMQLPTIDEFKTWLSVDDIEDDRITRNTEDTYNKVNDWMSYMDGEDEELYEMFDLVDKKTNKMLKTKNALEQVYNTIKRAKYNDTINALKNI